MHIHTKFGIPTSKNIRDMLRTQKINLKIRSEVKVTVTWNGMCDTLSSQDAFRHQIWNSYLKEYRRYAPDSMQFLEIRSEVKFKVTVTQLWYATLPHPKMHSQTKFEIPTSNNIRDMLRTRLFLKLGHRSNSRSQWPIYGTGHFVISRCIITLNLRFLAQILL